MSFVHVFAPSVVFQMPLSVPAIGLELRVRVSPATTGGAVTVIETTNAPGFGPPLHRHREAEIFHVLAGRYLFEVDGDRFYADTGYDAELRIFCRDTSQDASREFQLRALPCINASSNSTASARSVPKASRTSGINRSNWREKVP